MHAAQHTGVKIVAKFLLNYHDGKMAETPEEQASVMAEWTTWFGQLGSALVDGGQPVAATKTVASDGTVSDGASAASSGYSIIQADSFDQAVKASQMCPVLKSGGSVEVGQLIEM